MGNSCPLIEKPQSSDRFVKSQNPHGQSQRTTPATNAIAAAAASSLSRKPDPYNPTFQTQKAAPNGAAFLISISSLAYAIADFAFSTIAPNASGS
jgi:cell division septation protein DedD